MDRQQIGLKLTIDELGLLFQIDSFKDRLILQKAVYLAQAAGVNLGYYHHWYLYGPYCPALTRDEYAIDNERSHGMDDSQSWKLDNESIAILQKLKGIFTDLERKDLSRKLELLASVHFLVHRKQVARDRIEEIVDTLKRFQKDFNANEVQEALGELTKYGLLPGQTSREIGG